MGRTTTALLGGLLLGTLMTLVAVRLWQPDIPLTRDGESVTVEITSVSTVVANQHRENLYSELESIEDVLALPSNFARREALHVLVGRASPVDLQSLVFETSSLTRGIERREFLEILFGRIVETDPESALSLVRLDEFARDPWLEKSVWRLWALNDFEEAFFAAKTQTSDSAQQLAVEGLYAASGAAGNENATRIKEETGFGPDLATRSSYISNLARRSPEEAADYINNLSTSETEQWRWQALMLLADAIPNDDESAAQRIESSLTSMQDRMAFAGARAAVMAKSDPIGTLEKYLSGTTDRHSHMALTAAANALAKSDLTLLQSYYDAAGPGRPRGALAQSIGRELAKTDPVGAIEWARENDSSMFPMIQMTVLAEVARSDPKLAIASAISDQSDSQAEMLVSNLVQQVAARSPEDARLLLDGVDSPEIRLQINTTLVNNWMQTDPDQAMAWIDSAPASDRPQMLMGAVAALANNDIERAISLLPRLDDERQQGIRQHLASRLAQMDVQRAIAFVKQHEGRPDYDLMQASVVGQVAKRDPAAAISMASQIAEPQLRDNSLASIVIAQADKDPAGATSTLESITNPQARKQAATQLASRWYANDPDAATRWLNGLSDNEARDSAIFQIARQWRSVSDNRLTLLNSISNEQHRIQVKIQVASRMYRRNPSAAERLIQDPELSDEHRRQIKQVRPQTLRNQVYYN